MKGVLILTILIGLRTANGEWVDDLSVLLSNVGLSEGTGVGAIVGFLRYNSSEGVVFSTTSEYFDVTPNGTVSLKKQLVYKTLKTFQVTFAAKPTSQAEDTRTFTVKVLPINHAPTFDAPSYRVSLTNPNPSIGSVIYNSILVTDSDEGNNGSVTVNCDRTLNADAGQTCDFFSVSASRNQGDTYSVTVTLSKLLSPNRQSYDLSLKAMDGGNLSSSATFQVIVESLVDSRPVFIDPQPIIDLVEFAPQRSVASVVKVRDGRPSTAGNTLTFDIQDDVRNWFGVGQPQISADGVYSVPILVLGNISLLSINMNTRYTFNFYARQSLNGQLNGVNSFEPVIVNIRDVNDNAPTFGQSSYAAYASEGLTNGATIAGLSILVYDNDLGNNSYFELSVESVPSPVPGIFGLVPTSGQGNAAVAVIVNRPEYVRFINQLPRSYTLTLTARETRTVERRFSTATVGIQVTSPINHPPYFPNILNPVVVLDNIPVGSTISNYIRAQDDDQGPNGVLTYSLGNDPVANNYFSINNQTGVLSLKSPFNYNVKSTFTFSVIATDGGGLSASMSILINLVDSKRLGPQFVQPSYTANVTELMTDIFPPITIRATLEPMRNDRVMMYSLSTALSPEILSIFRVGPRNGSLTMVKGVDYMDTPNKQGYFDLPVLASVVGYPEIPVSTVNCRIYVMDTNNHAPYFVPVNQTYRKTIKDNTPPSTVMFSLNATDDDVGVSADIIYYTQSGTSDNFDIDPFNGVLTVSRYPRLVPDTTYNITVIAVDRGQPPLTGTTMVYITVIDSISRPPVFQFNEYIFYVVEGSPPGLLIGAARATSLDRRAIIAYSFLDTTWRAYNYSDIVVDSTEVQKWFSLSSSTAEIKVQGNIVYAQARKVTVVLSARITNPDPDVTGQISTNVSVTIFILPRGENTDIVRFSPETNFFYIQIYEQLPINTEIFQFNAFYYATSTRITDFSFYNQSADGRYLTLERTTGILRTAEVIYYSQINPTKNLTYYLLARANPPSLAQAGARVVVNILPLSGNLVFNQSNYNFSVYSNDLPGKVIGQVYTVKPPNVAGQIFYSIDNLDISKDIFQINENGTIILLRRLDELNSTRLVYTLLISATLPNNSVSKAVVYIQVIPVPLAPRFNQLNYKFDVLSNFNGPIGRVSAYDPNPLSKFPVTYNLVGTSPAANTFSIDPKTGEISMMNPTAVGSYILNVSATVDSTPPLTSYTPVNVQVFGNSMDNPPQFTNFPQDVFSVYYNDFNALILSISSNQMIVPPGRNATLSLDTSALPADAKNYFYFDPVSRELRVNGSLIGTVSKNYTLLLVLNDGTASSVKEITVGSYSNAAPTFSCKPRPIQVNVLDFSPAGTLLTPSVGIATNTPCSYNKPDTKFFYQILSSNLTLSAGADMFNEVFAIDNQTGQISSRITMNAYLLDWTWLKVLVAPNSSAVEYAKRLDGAIADVIVRFIGQTVRNPTFDNKDPYCPGSGLILQRAVMDLSPINTPVVKVHAGDCDMPGFGEVMYDIQGTTFTYYADTPESESGSPVPEEGQRAFGIDPNSGQVYTQVEDFRPFYRGWFSTSVRATARNNNNLKANANLKFYVIREYQMLKASFNRGVSSVRNDSEKLLSFVNGLLMPDYQILPSLITTYVDNQGARNISASSMCYALLKLDKPSGDYYVTRDSSDVKYLDNKTVLANLRMDYGLESPFDDCFSGGNFTTKWWSDKWFLWFILIAFSILVFVVALVLTCCVCFYWPMNLKEISKARPYVVLGDPAMSTGGSVMGERW